MRYYRYYFLAALCVLTLSLAPPAVADEGVHLFILSGQSNMNGVKPEEVFIPAVEKRFGVDCVIVVKDSQGGQPIRRWDKGWNDEQNGVDVAIGDLYNRLIKKVKEAVAGRELKTVTFIWMQGERDAREGNASRYAESFQRVLQQIEEDLGHEGINYVIGRLNDFGMTHPEYPDWQPMREVQMELAGASKRGRWVDTDDLNDGVRSNGKYVENDLHLTVEGYRRFADRLANSTIELLQRTDIPYELVPELTPDHHRVRYDGSDMAGELRFAAQYTIWIPPSIKTLRGVIVHQHGCGAGSARSGLTGAFDLHWQALAAKHGCALLAATYEQPFDEDCHYWCEPREGSQATFQRALVDLGRQAGHPELATVPWALWGHSGGGYWVGNMLLLYPERVAAAWLQSGTALLTPFEEWPDALLTPLPEQGIEAPVMLCLGIEEGYRGDDGRFKHVWPRAKEFFTTLRAKGAPIGVAVDPLTGHGCGEQRYLAIPWFDACLSHRLGDGGEAVPWLAPLMGPGQPLPTATPAKAYPDEGAKAIWLPSAEVARIWTQFINGEKITDSSPPPPPTAAAIEGGVLAWQPHADLQSGISHFEIWRDGELVATVPKKPLNPRGRDIAQGLQYSDTPLLPLIPFRWSLKEGAAGDKATYSIVAVNTLGLKSDPIRVRR
ncbi:MAG: sialate O-acetylesterase [Cyanobacteria bacterium J06638_22]